MTPQAGQPGLGRLKVRAEFLRVAGRGRKWAAPGLVLQAAERTARDDGAIRVGLTASRKVGNAVARNRARRRLRALAGSLLPSHGRPGFDYVLIARKSTVSQAYADLERDLVTALSKVHRDRKAAS